MSTDQNQQKNILLPVYNQEQTINLCMVLFTLFIFLDCILIFSTSLSKGFIALGVFFIFWEIMFIRNLHKTNISQVSIIGDYLKVVHKSYCKIWFVPIAEIKKVTKYLDYYIDTKGRFSNVFVFHLKNQYLFGNKIKAAYRFKPLDLLNDHKSPMEIRLIYSIMRHSKKEKIQENKNTIN